MATVKIKPRIGTRSFSRLINSQLARGTARVQKVSTGGGSNPAILWAVQWRTTGSAADQRRDLGAGGYRFDAATGAGLSVVTAASTGISGWPTANVLRVASAEDEDGNCRVQKTGLATLAAGSSRYWRWYVASTLGDIDDWVLENPPYDSSAHPIESNSGTIEWGMGHWWRDSTINPPNNLGNSITVDPPNQWIPSVFAHGQTGHAKLATGGGFPLPVIQLPQYTVYRFEYAIHRHANGTTFTLETRLYNAAGDLLYDTGDYYYDNGETPNDRTYTVGDATNFNKILMGSNQGAFMPSGSTPSHYQAAPACSDEGWLGPYNAATEANWDV